MTPAVDCDKLCIDSVIPRATTKTAVHKDTLKSVIDNLK